jgi:nicotinamide-nucleotide amidase
VEVHLNGFDEVVGTLGDTLRTQGLRLATAESCTGGMIAAACTAVSGSSDWFERGFVTYSNEAKTEMLGVDAALIAAHGAVSAEVAAAMAAAAERLGAECGLGITGVAGPTGGTPAKPVGTVWLATARRGRGRGAAQAELLQFQGDRAAVRRQTVERALQRLLACVAP